MKEAQLQADYKKRNELTDFLGEIQVHSKFRTMSLAGRMHARYSKRSVGTIASLVYQFRVGLRGLTEALDNMEPQRTYLLLYLDEINLNNPERESPRDN